MLNTVKMLLGITDSDKDAILEFCIDEAKSLILGYCRIDTLPDALASTSAAIAADLFRAKGYGETQAPEEVKSMTEGQRSVTFESTRPTEGNILSNYYRRLKPYRNLRGRVPSDV